MTTPPYISRKIMDSALQRGGYTHHPEDVANVDVDDKRSDKNALVLRFDRTS